MAPPPCPCPACAPCADRLGQAQGSECRAAGQQGRWAGRCGCSLLRDLLWVPNLISLATRLPYLFLSYTVQEEQASQTDREKAPAPPVFLIVCRLAAISRDPARIPWFAPASNPSQRVSPAVAQQPSKPPLLLPAGGTPSSWHSWYVATCPHPRGGGFAPLRVHRCEPRQSFARASLVLRRPRSGSTGHAPAWTSATRLTVCYMTRYETTPSRPPPLYLNRRPTVSQHV